MFTCSKNSRTPIFLFYEIKIEKISETFLECSERFNPQKVKHLVTLYYLKYEETPVLPEPGVEDEPVLPEPGVEDEPVVPEPGVEDRQHDGRLQAEGEVGVGHHLPSTSKSF